MHDEIFTLSTTFSFLRLTICGAHHGLETEAEKHISMSPANRNAVALSFGPDGAIVTELMSWLSNVCAGLDIDNAILTLLAPTMAACAFMICHRAVDLLECL